MKRFYAVGELPLNKWIKIIGQYDAFDGQGMRWYYEEEDKK